MSDCITAPTPSTIEGLLTDLEKISVACGELEEIIDRIGGSQGAESGATPEPTGTLHAAAHSAEVSRARLAACIARLNTLL